MVVTHVRNGVPIAEFLDNTVLVTNAGDFLDLAVSVSSRTLVFRKRQFHEDFFNLRTGIAGEILQKASTYRLSVGIVGDFSEVRSRSFRDFIRESNGTGQVVFTPTVLEALGALSSCARGGR